MSINSTEQLFYNIEQLIYTCCKIKKIFVETDEKDKGQRMLLNFGHTIGHVIEKHMNYKITHGEAVSAGMLYITKNSETMGLTEKGTCEKIRNMLDHFNIEYKLPNINTEDIKKYIYLDKKNLFGEINFILLKKIGDATIKKVPISEAEKFIDLNWS